MIRYLHALAMTMLLFIVGIGPLSASEQDNETNINALLNDAESHVWLGISNNGATRAFDQGLQLVNQASKQLESSNISATRRQALSKEIIALEEQLSVLIALYQQRFYGVFPLARLVMPTKSHDGEKLKTEHMYHPPEVAAVDAAATGFASKVDNIDRPQVVIRSTPLNRALENVVFEVLARSTTALPVVRRDLVNILGTTELEAFDNGADSPATVQRLLDKLDSTSLIILDINKVSADTSDLVKYKLAGNLYLRGDAINGSSDGSSPHVRVATILSVGSILDRRGQFWSIMGSQLALLIAAMVWSSRVNWSLDGRLKTIVNLGVGAGLFIYGRVFAIVSVFVLAGIAPEPSVLVSAAWWWPAALGVLVVLAVGFCAWIGQALITNVVPGSRGSRAVGTIFGLSALGAASHFIQPVMMLDQSAGFNTLVPFIIASVSLAVLFAYAVRTGPPVPHYFAIGPALAAAMVGISLLMTTPVNLWGLVALCAVMYLVAAIRYRRALARGTEEPEPSPETAADNDRQRLVKLSEDLEKKL
jgi:hypothetical protein